jgi:lipopolysaccharide export LptBFGC system permease protein LptF
MLWTLQTYIFREMGKTFLLTAIGLIAVIGLGGGVMNMIELDGIGALQLLKIVGLILPVAATLTLPIAALYAATVTYGRLSADNELVACRSGGINIHVLFLPTLVISLLSAASSFVFINFVIPNMIRNLDRFVGDDLPRIIKQQLSTAERFSLRDKFVIHADRTSLERTDDGKPVLRLSGVAFTEMDDGAWVRFGTARSILIAFGKRDGLPTLAADMYGISLYDAQRHGFADSEHQVVGESTIPRRLPIKVKWLTLAGLLEYGGKPETFPAVEEQLERLRGGMARGLFFAELANAFREQPDRGGHLRRGALWRHSVTYTIRSRKCTLDRDDKRPRFQDNVVIVEQWADGLTRTVRADDAVVDVRRGVDLAKAKVDVTATGNVAIEDPRAGGSMIRRDRQKLEPIQMPAEIVERARRYSGDELLDPDGAPLRLGKWVKDRRVKVIAGVQEIAREITGELHARMAFSVSVFVLVVLGAALGIVFRGSQVLVAFGISFVPSLFVITAIIMGKQLIDKPGMELPGISVLWMGIVLVALVDAFVLMRVLRR